MFRFIYSDNSLALSDEALRLESSRISAGDRPLLLSARHIGKLQMMDLPDISRKGTVIVDEAHLCKRNQIEFLRSLSRRHGLEVICLGERCNENDLPWEGSCLIMAWADEIISLKSEKQAPSPQEYEEPDIPPLLAQFLDAESAPARLKLFRDNREAMDGPMLETIAAVLDIELRGTDNESRADDIQSCLETIVKYEIERR